MAGIHIFWRRYLIVSLESCSAFTKLPISLECAPLFELCIEVQFKVSWFIQAVSNFDSFEPGVSEPPEDVRFLKLKIYQ